MKLTHAQRAALITRVEELARRHLSQGTRRGLMVLQLALGPDMVLEMVMEALVNSPDIRLEEKTELSRLEKGNQPDEQCERCPIREECWNGQASPWPQREEVEGIPAEIAEFLVHLEPVN